MSAPTSLSTSRFAALVLELPAKGLTMTYVVRRDASSGPRGRHSIRLAGKRRLFQTASKIHRYSDTTPQAPSEHHRRPSRHRTGSVRSSTALRRSRRTPPVDPAEVVGRAIASVLKGLVERAPSQPISSSQTCLARVPDRLRLSDRPSAAGAMPSPLAFRSRRRFRPGFGRPRGEKRLVRLPVPQSGAARRGPSASSSAALCRPSPALRRCQIPSAHT